MTAVVRYIVRREQTSHAAEGLGEICVTEEAAVRILRGVWSELPDDRESFVCLMLDARSRIVGYEVVAIGTQAGVEVHPRELLRAAILVGAAAIIVAHNHPTGDPAPSTKDYELTARIADACALIGIPLMDHIVLGDGRHRTISTEQARLVAGKSS